MFDVQADRGERADVTARHPKVVRELGGAYACAAPTTPRERSMSMPFDATLKDLGRDGPADFLISFDRPPTGALTLLNVDLSTVTTSADLVIGVGDPLEEIIHLDFQSSAAAWKHANVLVYNALIYADHHVPVHSIMILLRPQAAHFNLNGVVSYAARSGRGSMNFSYEVVRLWERPADELLAGPLGTVPLAVLGTLPEGVPQAYEHSLPVPAGAVRTAAWSAAYADYAGYPPRDCERSPHAYRRRDYQCGRQPRPCPDQRVAA